MTTTTRARIAYFNGRFLPEPEVRVPFRDRGFKYGDAVFDTTRTFGHRIFKMREHIDRLYRSLRYLRIDPGLSPATLADVTEEVLRRNLPLLEPDDDYWVTQRVSRGHAADAEASRDLLFAADEVSGLELLFEQRVADPIDDLRRERSAAGDPEGYARQGDHIRHSP